MTNLVLFFLIAFLQETEVPFKLNDEFEIQIDYQFKQRSNTSTNSNYTIDFVETVKEQEKKRYNTGIRPYLLLNVKINKLSDQEFKMKASNNVGRTLYNKKVEAGDVLKIDMGFTDDVKDRVGPYEVTIVFSSKEKKEISRIHMFVQEDGTFLVNGQVRGKF